MQQRRATAATWDTSGYVLAAGELGVTTDTGIIKVGDGVNAWSALPIAFEDQYLPLLGTAANSDLLGGVSVSSLVKVADTSVSATGNKYVQRTADGGVKGTDANENDELTSLQQMNAAITTSVQTLISRTLTAAGTLAATDINKTVYVNQASLTTQVVVTVPTNATAAMPVGSRIDICAVGAGGAKLSGAAGVTLYGKVNVMPGYGVIRLYKINPDEWVGIEVSKGTRNPRMKVACTVAGQSFGSAYAFVQYDTVVTADSYNPDNEWFSIPGTGLSTARRLICNKDGEYTLQANVATTAGSVMYARIARMTADNSTTGMEIKSVQSFTAVASLSITRRVAAGQSFGVHVGFVSGATGKADGEYSGAADPNSFIITRIGD
jgi:hypothetical protein